MLIDIFLIIIIFVSLLILIRILISKFPILAKINIEEISKEKEKKLKLKILEKKVIEKIKKIGFNGLFAQSLLGRGIKKIKDRILRLEEKYHQKYSEIIKETPRELERRIKNLFRVGEKFLEKKDLESAEKKFTEIISFDPRNLGAFKNLLKIYLLKNNFSQAKEIAKYILQLNKQAIKWCSKFGREVSKEIIDEFVLSLTNLGLIYQEIEQRERATNCFKKALEYSPNNPRLLDFLIENSIILKKKEEAEKYLAKLKEVNPENQKIIDWEERIKDI